MMQQHTQIQQPSLSFLGPVLSIDFHFRTILKIFPRPPSIPRALQLSFVAFLLVLVAVTLLVKVVSQPHVSFFRWCWLPSCFVFICGLIRPWSSLTFGGINCCLLLVVLVAFAFGKETWHYMALPLLPRSHSEPNPFIRNPIFNLDPNPNPNQYQTQPTLHLCL